MILRMPAAAAPRRLHLGPCFAAALLLAACQTAPQPVPPGAAPEQVIAGWPAREALLQERSQFTAQGRIGVAAGADGFNGHLRWIQDGARSTISPDGPLGVGGARITSEPGLLTLTTPSGAALDSQAAQDELVRRMGFEPPLQSLRYWLQGVPDPAGPSTETTDAQGYLASLAQSGWTLTCSAYMQTAAGALPQKLTLVRGTVRVRLIIESWTSP
jgi:outer membrane lipoprotein LolB